MSARGNNSTYSEEDIRENLLKFGAMVNLVGQHIDVMFINFLSRVHPDFNITELMFKLSPKCSSILRRCSWRGRLMPCDRLFSTRITSLGFCCVFNSRYQLEDVNTPPKILDITGQDFGLSFVIQNSEDEFVYRRRPSIGYEVMMFEGSEYPLVEGGGVRLFPVQPNTSLFLTLRARAERHTSSLLLYNEKRRGCRVRDWWGPRSWRSSYAWCLTACRRRTVAALCACRPYTLPPGDTFVPQCTLNHLPCLNKHKEKFMYYYPGEESDPSLSEERQDAQECQRCSPDCARVAYSAAAAYKHYRAGETIFQNYVSKGIGLVNASIVRVFYTSEHQQQYSVEANQRWYEVTAFLASQWVAVMSVTVVFISEVLFYCTLRWAHHYRRRARAAREIIIHKLC